MQCEEFPGGFASHAGSSSSVCNATQVPLVPIHGRPPAGLCQDVRVWQGLSESVRMSESGRIHNNPGTLHGQSEKYTSINARLYTRGGAPAVCSLRITHCAVTDWADDVRVCQDVRVWQDSQQSRYPAWAEREIHLHQRALARTPRRTSSAHPTNDEVCCSRSGKKVRTVRLWCRT